ncbi:hypothetical protein KSD_34540 [Ktedonobacter sp. SOSP1-85]|uniref:Yip1 family protein n=1 Tax=Ktedonobacter sp. SOSP1-85 TaxID=2778367 RepID=UPI001914F1AC|nr:Yip1 family protein [Ktedonobacter sp. SOSP1-85]GHO75683.1 hypothetical protein KSD_34540 [Ktedonobacter sp. SOSP1-85]
MSHEPEEGKTPDHPQESSPRESEYREFGGQNINGAPEQPAYTQPSAYTQPIPPYPPQGGYPQPIFPYQQGYPQPIPPYPYLGAYPQPVYPYPPQRADARYYPEPPPTPLTLKEGLRQLPRQWWKVVSKPSIRSFAEEKGKASWSVILILLLIYAIVQSATLILEPYIPGTSTNISNTLNQNLSQSTYSSTNVFNFADFTRAILLIEGLFGIILFPLSYLFGEGIYFLIAKLFKGRGSYLQQVYADMLYIIPTTVGLSILSLVPFLGGILQLILSMFIGVYFYVLRIFATQAVHRLSIGRALAVVFIPLGLAFLLSFLMIIIFFFVIIGFIAFFMHLHSAP